MTTTRSRRWSGIEACLLVMSGYAVACSGEHGAAPSVATEQQGIIYGADDRTEAYLTAESPLGEAAMHSTALIAALTDVTPGADGGVQLTTATLRDTDGVCATEPYASQPSAGFCTGVLVGPDLVVTAGHCLALHSCEDLAVVFEFHYDAPDILHQLRAEDVYRCAEVLSVEVGEPSQGVLLDHGFIRLDRAVAAPLVPVVVNVLDAAMADDAAVSLVGHGEGLPTKIAGNGLVTDGRPETRDYFFATVDNFDGGSGAGVFDSQNRLVGVAARGNDDFTTSDDGCLLSVRTDTSKGEQISYLSRAVESLCADGDRGLALCHRAGTSNGGNCSVSRHARGTPFLVFTCAVGLLVLARRRVVA